MNDLAGPALQIFSRLCDAAVHGLWTICETTTDILFARLSKLHELADHERGVLRLIEGRPKRSYQADDRLLSEKSEIHGPHFITSGWACSMRELKDGRRQIFNVLLPGDAIGLSVRSKPRSFTNIIAVTTVRIVEAPEIAVAWRERSRVPGIAAALDQMAAEEESFMLAHVMRLGRQTAYECMAHWIMELDYRMAAGVSATARPSGCRSHSKR
jgi:CRP-like cAMP-binding protein